MSGSRRVYEQSAVIPYRFQEGELQVLVITSNDGGRWVIPKGDERQLYFPPH